MSVPSQTLPYPDGELAESAVHAIHRESDAAPASARELLVTLRSIEICAAQLEPSTFESDPTAVAALARELRTLIEHATRTLNALQDLDDREREGAVSNNAEALEAWLEECPTVVAPARPRVADLCFAGGLELKRTLRELSEVRGTEDALVATETAHRNLRRAIRAVLEGARTSIAPAQSESCRPEADLESALAVRRLYSEFRKGLRPPQGGEPDDVLMALRYAAGAFASLIAAPEFALVRASDRTLLRHLRERVLTWARDDKSVEAGLKVLEDVRICADLLRGINRRQELRAHDAALIQALLEGPGESVATWFARLEELTGLDDELDELIARAQSGPPENGLVSDTLLELSRLR